MIVLEGKTLWLNWLQIKFCCRGKQIKSDWRAAPCRLAQTPPDFATKLKSCKSTFLPSLVLMSRRTFDILISCRPAAHSSTNPNLAIKSFQSELQVDIWSTIEQISNKCSGKCPGRRAQICSRAAIFAVISIFEVIYSKYWNWCGKGLQTKVCSDGTSSNGNVELEEIFSTALCIASLEGNITI